MTIHAEQRVIAYTPAQLYGLVADVEKYPEFLPWCLAARVRRRQRENGREEGSDTIVADLVIGFKMFRERFTSYVRLDEAALRIHVTYAEGPFKHLTNHWVFLEHEDGCLIDFYVDFEFRSVILQKVIGALFHEAVRRMVAAFEARARDIYGSSGETAMSTVRAEPKGS